MTSGQYFDNVYLQLLTIHIFSFIIRYNENCINITK